MFLVHSAVALRQLAEVERSYTRQMFSVYALYNPKYGKIYIGQTADLAERLRIHAEGTFKNSFTAKHDGQWILIYSESANTRVEAIAREKQLKSFRGREFIKKYIP